MLSNNNGGNAACLVIGGAIESLEAKPGNFTLNLLNKKGFIKSAIKTGYVKKYVKFIDNYSLISNITLGTKQT